MRKLLMLLLTVILVLLSVGCADREEVVEIEGRFFLTQVNHIRRNSDDYIGRTVQYEGMFRSFYWPATGLFHMVHRHTLGCCGYDGIVGFEVDLGDIEPFPDDAWVEVIGVLTQCEEDNRRTLRVIVTSITEVDERGEEVVLQ